MGVTLAEWIAPAADSPRGYGDPMEHTQQRLAVASRAAVPPFHVMDLLAAAAAERGRTHGDLLNLVAGQPSTPAPVPVREAAKRALDEEVLGYTVARRHPRAARGRSPATTAGCTAWTSGSRTWS